MLDFRGEKKDMLGYDLKDDLICFMQNDPTFYRKEYYPVIHKFKEYTKSGKTVAPRAFEGLVKHAYECYQNKFPVEGLDPTLEADMCEDVCKEIHRIEEENIKKGLYDN